MIDKVKYNKTFQSKIIASLVTDKQFLQKMYPIIDYTLFDSVELQQVVRWTMNYWENYKDIPNREYFELELNKIDVKTDKALKYGLNELVNNVYDVHIPSNGLEYIKDESFNFFNNQNWKKTILLCVDAVEGEDFDQVQKLIKDAYSVTNQTEIGLDYKTTAIDRYTKLKRVTVTTGFDELDQALKGGFGNGDLITIIAPTGIGKSWLLANFGSNALLAGKNVVHFTLELTETQTAIRYDTILTKTPVNILEKDPSLVDNFINNNPQLGESIISFYTMKSVTVPKLKTHVEQIRVDKFKPDIVFIDYGDLIKPTSNYRDKRLNLEEVYEDLKKMAQELDIPIVTASQTNRCHDVNDLVDTPSGKVKIGTLKEGDEVLTHKGFRKVIKVYPIERQPIYKIMLKSGKVINVSANHELPTLYGKLKTISTGLEVGDKLFTKKK